MDPSGARSASSWRTKLRQAQLRSLHILFPYLQKIGRPPHPPGLVDSLSFPLVHRPFLGVHHTDPGDSRILIALCNHRIQVHRHPLLKDSWSLHRYQTMGVCAFKECRPHTHRIRRQPQVLTISFKVCPCMSRLSPC